MSLQAQVGIGTTAPHSRALLDLQNNGAYRGLQVPQVGPGGRAAMAADLGEDQIGLIVADTSNTTGGFYVWGGTDWVRVNLDQSVWQRNATQTFLEHPSDNVGIGTNNPQHRLSVGTATGDVQPITIRGYSNIGDWKGGAAFGFSNSSVIMGELYGVANIGGHSATLGAWADLALNSGGGNVGVGTAAPTAKLHVAGSFRLANGSEAAGRVLISSADGTATWTTPAAETDPKVGTLITDRVPRWGGTALQDAPIYTSGNNVGIGKVPVTLFEIGNASGFSVDLDQSINSGSTGGLRAQSFRPTVSGNLAGFDMLLNGFSGDVLSIQMHAGEDPSTPNPISPVLDFTYPADGTNWYQVLFASPIPVVAGQDYHIVMNSVVGAANITIAVTNPLPNGRLFYNFGFWQPFSSTDDLTFRTLMENTSSYMVVDGATGQVGIGTTTPTNTLHVDGTLRLVNGTEAAGHVLTSDANGVGTWQAPAVAPSTGWTKSGSNVVLSTITDNVGVGVALPGARLEVAAGLGNLRMGPRLTWAGGDNPTIYSSIGTEYLMLHSPHIPYLVNGQYGYVGSTVGARVRFASDGTTSSFWDAGVPSYAGADRFTIARNEVPLMVVTNNTRVGIGTTLPEASLDIAAGNIQIADAARLGFQITDVFSFDAKSMGQYSIGWYGDSWEPGGNTLWMSGFGGIRMFTNGQPRMSINRSGFVGINSNTPQHRFTIGNASDGQNVQLRVFADDGYAWKGGAAFGHTSASVILGESSGVATIGGHNGNLSAWSTLAINPAGGAYVGIGTYTPDVMLSVNGQVRASCGLLICSDRNYKREIVPIAHALRDLLKLEGVSYYWRTDEFTNMGFTEDQQLGVIAQNVEVYFPQAVQTMPSGLKTVDYTKLVPVLIEALKEENSQRTANEQQLMRLIQDLADQNRDLQQQLDALKADTQKAAK